MSSATLTWKPDTYRGVIIEPESLPDDVDTFKVQISDSLRVWREEGKRGIWLKVPLAKSQLVPQAVQQGFIFHHAEADYLMMTSWLPGSPSTLPANASHQIGVGAFVLNSRNEVLLVREKSGPAAKTGILKLPTGLLDQGEDIHMAAEREVWEECGLRVKFQAIIGFRQAHGVAFGKDDLFFVVALTLEDSALDEISIQESELVEAGWHPLSEFLELPHFRPGTVWGHLNELCVRWARGAYPGIEMSSLPIGFRPGENTTYFNRAPALPDSPLSAEAAVVRADKGEYGEGAGVAQQLGGVAAGSAVDGGPVRLSAQAGAGPAGKMQQAPPDQRQGAQDGEVEAAVGVPALLELTGVDLQAAGAVASSSSQPCTASTAGGTARVAPASAEEADAAAKRLRSSGSKL